MSAKYCRNRNSPECRRSNDLLDANAAAEPYPPIASIVHNDYKPDNQYPGLEPSKAQRGYRERRYARRAHVISAPINTYAPILEGMQPLPVGPKSGGAGEEKESEFRQFVAESRPPSPNLQSRRLPATFDQSYDTPKIITLGSNPGDYVKKPQPGDKKAARSHISDQEMTQTVDALAAKVGDNQPSDKFVCLIAFLWVIIFVFVLNCYRRQGSKTRRNDGKHGEHNNLNKFRRVSGDNGASWKYNPVTLEWKNEDLGMGFLDRDDWTQNLVKGITRRLDVGFNGSEQWKLFRIIALIHASVSTKALKLISSALQTMGYRRMSHQSPSCDRITFDFMATRSPSGCPSHHELGDAHEATAKLNNGMLNHEDLVYIEEYVDVHF